MYESKKERKKMEVLEVKRINIPINDMYNKNFYPYPGLFIVNEKDLIYIPAEESLMPFGMESNYRMASIVKIEDKKEEPKSGVSEKLLLDILDRTVNNPNK